MWYTDHDLLVKCDIFSSNNNLLSSILGLVTCQHGGTQWTDGNCYLIQSQNFTSWQEAQKSCGQINATLVSIENKEKLGFIRDDLLNRFVKF